MDPSAFDHYIRKKRRGSNEKRRTVSLLFFKMGKNGGSEGDVRDGTSFIFVFGFVGQGIFRGGCAEKMLQLPVPARNESFVLHESAQKNF